MRHPSSVLLVLALLALLHFTVTLTACKSGSEKTVPAAGVMNPSGPFVACLDGIKRRVYAQWKYPRDLGQKEWVVLRFMLDAEGKLDTLTLKKASNASLAQAALAAMTEAAPFSDEANRCPALVGRPLLIRLDAAREVR